MFYSLKEFTVISEMTISSKHSVNYSPSNIFFFPHGTEKEKFSTKSQVIWVTKKKEKKRNAIKVVLKVD